MSVATPRFHPKASLHNRSVLWANKVSGISSTLARDLWDATHLSRLALASLAASQIFLVSLAMAVPVSRGRERKNATAVAAGSNLHAQRSHYRFHRSFNKIESLKDVMCLSMTW